MKFKTFIRTVKVVTMQVINILMMIVRSICLVLINIVEMLVIRYSYLGEQVEDVPALL